MPRRREILATGQIYHIFNRGVEKRTIFENSREYRRFLDLVEFYQKNHGKQFSRLSREERAELIDKKIGNPIIEPICYCLMPNHFHLLLKQTADSGISQFMQVITDSYVKYFNTSHERVGPLFQGKFKAVRIQDDAQLLQVSRYIHLNPVTSYLIEKIEQYKWSSYQEYIGARTAICEKDIVLDQFKSVLRYREFVEDYADYAKKLAKIEGLIIEKVE